jgi:hypothetical protein
LRRRRGGQLMRQELQRIIERYTPTLPDALAAASTEDIARLEANTGLLPESYREFLQWMGGDCPFLSGEGFVYSPRELLVVYQNPGDKVPDGYILIGIDQDDSESDLHIRRQDGAIVRIDRGYVPVGHDPSSLENVSLGSYLLSAYVRTTLTPSHPFSFSAAFEGDKQQTQELWRRLAEACGHFEMPYTLHHPDFRFYGGDEFVVGVHQEPDSPVVFIHFGAVVQARYEAWHDLVFARWRFLHLPES